MFFFEGIFICGILCNEYFMIIVSLLENVWGLKKLLRYYYVYFISNSSKSLCELLVVCF